MYNGMMGTYFFMLAIPSVLAVFLGKQKGYTLFGIVFLIFTFLIGFRYNVGMDWSNYEYTHSIVEHWTIREVLFRPEPLSSLLFWTSANLDLGSLLSNVVAGSILMFGVLSFARITPNPWLAVVAATPYLIIAFGMTGIRQAMAAGVFLYVLSAWEQSGLPRKLTGIIVASLFHTSALIGLLLVLWDMRLRITYKIAIGIMLTAVVYFIDQNAQSYSDNLVFYQDAYLVGERIIESPGASFHIALIALPAALYFANRRLLDAHLHNARLLTTGSWVALGVILLLFVSSTAASRLTLYLYFVPMAIYSVLPLIVSRAQQMFVVSLLVALHFAILTSWLLYANNSAAHIPYRNLIFEN